MRRLLLSMAVLVLVFSGVKESRAGWSFTGLGAGTYAECISADGRVVVGFAGDRWAFRWEDGNMIELVPGRSHAWAASADGSIVVGTKEHGPSNFEAFYWKDGTMYLLA